MEFARFSSYRGFSVRSIFLFALTVIITVLLWATLNSTPANASGEAVWKNDSILFENHGYNKVSDFKDSTGTIPDGSTVFQTSAIPSTTGGSQRAFIIYFSPGLDPPTATSANYVEFNYDSSGNLSNPSGSKSISLTLKGQETPGSSCAVGGIGYIICPVSIFLADAMDNVFSILSGMIQVQPPVLGDSNNSLYAAWNITREIANVTFVIAFLIIIFSQITSTGVSNYGLKRLTPRLIVAAVLVNVSFIISALAIDISNVLGFSIQDIFNNIREDLFSLTNDNLENSMLTETWSAVTVAILAGGGVVGGVFFAASGGLYLLLPVLLGLLLTIIFVLVILAARQAIIVILVILAPLAFVANLLPNTEKLFGKWRDLFMTMLVFFPAFSLVFGGSQLAGQIIIQNAGDNIITLIFGMAVQVAPLVITPLLLKLSGGLLGRIAQIANDPRKGVLDRTKNWAEQRAEHAKQQNIAKGPRLRNPASWGAGMVRNADFKKRRLTDNTEAYKQAATNRYHESAEYKPVHDRTADANINRDRIQDDLTARTERQKVNPATAIHDSAMKAQYSKDHLEYRQNRTGQYYNTERLTVGTALNTSNDALEASKAMLEETELRKAAYLNDQRTRRTTALGMAAERLETAKLGAEGYQNRYNEHIEKLKLDTTSSVSGAARFAESTKEHHQAAEMNVKAVFDRERTTAGGVLNVSHEAMERAKIAAEGAAASLAEHTASMKTVGGVMHTEFIRTEKFKQSQQVAEAKLTRIVEEYKAGGGTDAAGNILVDGKIVTGAERTILQDMLYNSEQLSAETQGASSATNIQKQRIAELLATPGSARADELLDIAGSIDEDGKQRALATALAQNARTRKETLENISSIISFRNYSNEQIRELAEGKAVPGIDMSQDVMAAAMQLTFGGKDTGQIVQALKNIDFSFPHMPAEDAEELRILVSDTLLNNPSKPPFITAGAMGEMKQGNNFKKTAFTGAYGDPGLNSMIIDAINNNKFDSKKFQGAGNDYAIAVLAAVSDNPDAISPEAKRRLVSSLAMTLDPKREASEGLADSIVPLENIVKTLGGTILKGGGVELDDENAPKLRP